MSGLDKEKIIEITNTHDLKKRYELIYDYISDYLDQDRTHKNYCDFKNDECIANRLGRSVHEKNGCCYIHRAGICSHLKHGECSIKNIPCKLFVCEYLESQGIKYDLNKILPLKKFLNMKQRHILKRTYFKPKDEVINKLLACVKKNQI